MDDLELDDVFDLTDPDTLVLAAGSGVLDDEGDDEGDGYRCECACPCRKRIEWPGDSCDPCREGRHRDPFDPDDRR